MLPAPLITALAPLAIDALKGKAKDAGPIGEAVADMLKGSADHEKRKASVRPVILKATGTTSILIALAGIVAALSPLFGTPQETSDAMVWNLICLFGVVGGAYGYGATKRTIEKTKGVA